MHTGSCLCGAVRYEIVGPLAGIELCHCGQCRRASGSAFAANMNVAVANFRILSGQGSMKAFESSQGKQRVFCAECGSPIISRLVADPSTVRVRVGTLADPVESRAVFHFHTDSSASWWPPSDDLPRYPGPRPR